MPIHSNIKALTKQNVKIGPAELIFANSTIYGCLIIIIDLIYMFIVYITCIVGYYNSNL